MPVRGSVLVSGAGVAGTAAAYWLSRSGWDVVLVERAAALRTAGQNIDVRGAARTVVRRMGLEAHLLAAGTGEVGTRFVDRRGRTVAEFPAGTADTDGPTAEMEVLRGELVASLDALLRDRVAHRYGDSVRAVVQDAEGVDVEFAHGPPGRFDLLVVAEGFHSHTRRLVFGDVRLRDLGQYMAYGTVPRTAEDDHWWRWLPAGRGRAVMLRPDNVGTTRALLAFLGPPTGLERRAPREQVAHLREVFADVGWAAPRILGALAADHDDFYLDRVGQVHAPRWTHGRVALTGDAAYCPSPISGMGTSLALTGAYVLAGELTARQDHAAAWGAYEALMRPYVRRAQQLPPGGPRLVNPVSGVGVSVLHTVMRLAASRVGRAVTARLFAPPADSIALPAYP
ncbi:FAD-binding monooxygenase [Pilimelia terevasa]|uniref:FAD-binding monooxygenase n=1 Tax=Pilimelia terevasa TaxID=53372 RepID=A0A8J3BMW9_9ACTN|nr:FAD-dependent monooxygenase [Pilimelia terevasa]GGK22469.1 FAD-binding monooxygenase [Pilimelia terevasa]